MARSLDGRHDSAPSGILSSDYDEKFALLFNLLSDDRGSQIRWARPHPANPISHRGMETSENAPREPAAADCPAHVLH